MKNSFVAHQPGRRTGWQSGFFTSLLFLTLCFVLHPGGMLAHAVDCYECHGGTPEGFYDNVTVPHHAMYDPSIGCTQCHGGGQDVRYGVGCQDCHAFENCKTAEWAVGVLNVDDDYPDSEDTDGDSDFRHIQAAINAAHAGNTIVVQPGIYVENINFLGKAITVRSTNPDDPGVVAATVIDGGGLGTVVTFNSEEGNGAVLSGFTVQNGVTASNGGGIYCEGSSPTISKCTIQGNSAIYGGGIGCWNSSAIITGCKVTGNSATQAGGGIYYGQSSLTITNCDISDNSAGYPGSHSSVGGGICSDANSSGIITNCQIEGNDAVAGGGIMCMFGGSPIITDCTIADNTSVNEGGGLLFWASSATITNSIITGNSTGYQGGGICCESYYGPSNLTVTNCTISGNSAPLEEYGYGGGAGVYSDNTATLTNCIVWGNSENEITGAGAVVSYSDVRGGYPGEGNIDSDPIFIGGGDYHLEYPSTCIDSATATGAPATDKDGNLRPDGPGYDMGAYEYQYVAPTANFSAGPTSGKAPLTVGFTDKSTGAITSWSWDFGDNSNSTLQNPSHTYAKPGAYTVTMIVTGPGGSDDEIKTDYVVVDPIVTITAVDATASEPGKDTGTFRISRTGSTASALTVYYTIGGTATNGKDYRAIAVSKKIPAGASYAEIVITPLNDKLKEGSESVILNLSANAAYAIGSPGSDTVMILDND